MFLVSWVYSYFGLFITVHYSPLHANHEMISLYCSFPQQCMQSVVKTEADTKLDLYAQISPHIENVTAYHCDQGCKRRVALPCSTRHLQLRKALVRVQWEEVPDYKGWPRGFCAGFCCGTGVDSMLARVALGKSGRHRTNGDAHVLGAYSA
eukprot:1709321-Pyramimonas_sp.AAC.1